MSTGRSWCFCATHSSKTAPTVRLVRLTTPILPGETEADADQRLQEFTGVVVPSLVPYLPAPAADLKRATNRPQCEPEPEMIMSRLLQKPRVKILLLCVCLGLAMSVAGCGSREERAQAYYERGKDYLEKKDYVKARIEFRNAIQRKADLLPAWQALARIDEQEQNLAGASRDAPPDHRTCTKRSRGHDQACASLFVGRRQCARPGPEARQQSRRN